MVSGSLSWSRVLALVCGRSSGTPTVSRGAETMKMISRTSMTSTIGVTLISAMTGRRRCRRRPPATAAVPAPIAILRTPYPLSSPLTPLAPFIDLPRQNRGKLVGEPFQALGLLVHVGYELVIENSRRYGGHEADCGCEQGFRDTRGDHRQRGGLLARDRPKPPHDPPDPAQDARERPTG